jgi:hypothetical protein
MTAAPNHAVAVARVVVDDDMVRNVVVLVFRCRPLSGQTTGDRRGGRGPLDRRAGRRHPGHWAHDGVRLIDP